MHEIDRNLQKQEFIDINTIQGLIEISEDYETKDKLLNLLIQNNTTISTKLPCIFNLISKMKSVYDNQLVLNTLKYLKSIKDCEIDWICKIVFLILELTKDKKRNNEVKLLILENIRICSLNTNIINYLFNFMLNDNTSEIIYAILVFIPEVTDEFVRFTIQQTNSQILKNSMVVLSNLCTSQKHLFLHYKHFEIFLDSEFYFVRSCFLVIIYNLVDVFKLNNQIDEIRNIINFIDERLSDVYFNVRYKALSLIGSLLDSDSVPLDMKNDLITHIGNRILDKAIIVRKKAIQICSKVLINNPFGIKDTKDSEQISSNQNELDLVIVYQKDKKEFFTIMKKCLENVMNLLDSKISNDYSICIDFIKLCLFFNIEGSQECFEYSFDFIWENDGILECFQDIFLQLKSKKLSIKSFLKKFVKVEGNKSYEKIVKELYRKHLINIHDDLVKDILKGKDLYESTYLLMATGRFIENKIYFKILNYITNLLFSAQNKEDLIYLLRVYSNILNMNIRNKEENDSEIVKIIIKNISKMIFFDYKIMQETISFLYKIAINPDIASKYLLFSVSKKNINPYRSIYAVGCISMNHIKYLDKLEKKYKESKEKIDMEVPEDIKERRKSINASRMSLQSFIEDDETKVEYKIRKVSELESKDEKFSIDSSSFMENKTEEEISDFFFYIREKDILYNQDGLLYKYSKLIPEYCKSEDPDLQEIAYLTLFKMMCISSEYFLEHKDLFMQSLYNLNYKIRSNSVISMGDFLLLYNSLIEEDSKILFRKLTDEDHVVRKNTLLIIYNLLRRNILRLGSNSVYLTDLIFDTNTEISNITKNIICSLGENTNILTTMVYEKLSSSFEDYSKYIEFFLPLLKDKSKEMIFLKLLRTDISTEILKYIYTKFTFNENFVEDIKHLEEFKSLNVV